MKISKLNCFYCQKVITFLLTKSIPFIQVAAFLLPIYSILEDVMGNKIQLKYGDSTGHF